MDTSVRNPCAVFHKRLFFAPLSALLAWFAASLPWQWRSFAGLLAFFVIIAAPLGIELGQMLLPEKFPDTTDWVLEFLGGLFGYVLFGMLRLRPAPGSRRQQTARRRT